MRYGHVEGANIQVEGKKLLNLCSNDYLGIPTTTLQTKQMQSSSRLISGNDESYRVLEKKLAKHKSQQNALIFPTGYMTNLGVIGTVIKKGDVIISDELNHASIIESCKLSEAETIIYKHNDMQDLQNKLQRKGKSKFIITEGVFSMDGDLSNLKEISEVAEKSNSILVLDDAHGDFVLGDDGKGTANYLNVAKKIDVHISSLSKGLGSFGGYVASRNNVIDFCINKSKPFIYTSALPTFFIEHSLKRLNLDRKKYQVKLQKNTKKIINGLKQIGYQINSQTHIIPIIIGKEKTAMEFGKFLYKNGIFAQPVRYPTVQKNQARIRISVTAWLSNKDIDNALEIFEKSYKKFKI